MNANSVSTNGTCSCPGSHVESNNAKHGAKMKRTLILVGRGIHLVNRIAKAYGKYPAIMRRFYNSKDDMLSVAIENDFPGVKLSWDLKNEHYLLEVKIANHDAVHCPFWRLTRHAQRKVLDRIGSAPKPVETAGNGSVSWQTSPTSDADTITQLRSNHTNPNALVSLLERHRAGDKTAFTRLDNRCRPLLLGWLRQKFQNAMHAAECEVAVQEALIHLHDGMENFAVDRQLVAWLKAVAKNKSLNTLRRQRKVVASLFNGTAEGFDVRPAM